MAAAAPWTEPPVRILPAGGGTASSPGETSAVVTHAPRRCPWRRHDRVTGVSGPKVPSPPGAPSGPGKDAAPAP